MKKSKNQAGSTKGVVAAAGQSETTTIRKAVRPLIGDYKLKTPLAILKRNKVGYCVSYHQYSRNGQGNVFPEPQIVEFSDPVPIVARRKAFEYAKSLETYPNKKLSKFKVGKSSTPFKPLFGTSKDGLIRWCIIDFIEFGTYNQLRVYTEMNQGADEGTLRLLEVELETYQRLGFADDVPTTIVNDEEGNSHTIIDEGNEFADIKKAS